MSKKTANAAVTVNGDVEGALKSLKNMLNKNGVTQELKKRRYYMKPSEERQMAIKKAIQKKRRQERRAKKKTSH